MARGVSFNRFPELAAKLRPAVRVVIDETCKELETDLKASMAAAAGGRLYERGGKSHQASAPGQPPAVDYGHLIGSVGTTMLRDDLGLVYEGTEYAAPLEFGTTRMAARPHMTPAADRARPKFVRRMRELEDRLR